MLIIKNKIVIITAIIALLLIPIFLVLNAPLISKEQSEISFNFESGTSLTQLANNLYSQQALKYPQVLIFLAHITGTSTQLKAGKYDINHKTTLWQLWLQLKKGPIKPYSLTIVEGWTFLNLVEALNNNSEIIHTINGLSSNEIMQQIGHEGEIPEGRFFPDTYTFSRDTKDTDILLQAYSLMTIKLNKAWAARDPNIPYSCPYKALIAASLIEKESFLPNELSIISGVIIRRLQKNMYLQIDPTVIYGLGSKYTGHLTIKDLQLNTPYNTYMHKYLPPTPICAPGEKAIYAAMHPDSSAFLYYVAKGDGSHEFSSTLEEHNLAVKKYRDMSK